MISGGIWWAATISERLLTVNLKLERFDSERYTKDDARRDKEYMQQLVEASRSNIVYLERRIQTLERHESAPSAAPAATRPALPRQSFKYDTN